jgi:hypothetical protein
VEGRTSFRKLTRTAENDDHWLSKLTQDGRMDVSHVPFQKGLVDEKQTQQKGRGVVVHIGRAWSFNLLHYLNGVADIVSILS